MFGSISSATAQTVAKITQLFQAAKSNSLIEYSKMTRVEPVTLLDKGATVIPEIVDLMQTLTTLFAAYYLQAISLSIHVGNVDIIRLLDAVNPNRDLGATAASKLGHIVTEEGIKINLSELKLPEVSLEFRNGPGGSGVARPQPSTSNLNLATPPGNTRMYGPTDAHSADINDVSLRNLHDNVNLGVGKIVAVKLKSGNSEVTIPIQIRLNVFEANADSIVNVLSAFKVDKSLKERWHGWRSGELGFIKDIIFCTDLIDEHRKALMNDQERILADTFKRIRNNQMAGVASGAPSVASASTLIIITEDSCRRLERALMGRISDFEVREKLFEATYAMILCVVIPDRELVTFYYRSIAYPSTVTFRGLKGNSKDSSFDIMKILKSFQSGNSPSI